MTLWLLDAATVVQRVCAVSQAITQEQWRAHIPQLAYDPPCASG